MTHECCCPSCDARMIELIQAIDDLRRSLVIAMQERVQLLSLAAAAESDSYYWEHG